MALTTPEQRAKAITRAERERDRLLARRTKLEQQLRDVRIGLGNLDAEIDWLRQAPSDGTQAEARGRDVGRDEPPAEQIEGQPRS